jgi:hypothetical protein
MESALANAAPARRVPGRRRSLGAKRDRDRLRRSRIKCAGGKPATGRLCRTGPEISGEGPGLAHPSHRCDTIQNAAIAFRFPDSCRFREKPTTQEIS